MIQGETGFGAGSETGGAEGSSGAGSLGVSPLACGGALETSVASRSMVGGARLGLSWSGNDPFSSGLSSTMQRFP
jgi:hypothetical protein